MFPHTIVISNLFINIHSALFNDLSTAQPKGSIYDQLIDGRYLVVHEERGVVFSRVGYYYEIDDMFGLTITMPVTEYSNNEKKGSLFRFSYPPFEGIFFCWVFT